MQPTTPVKYNATYNSYKIPCNLQLLYNTMQPTTSKMVSNNIGISSDRDVFGNFSMGTSPYGGGGGAQHLLRPLNRLKTINLGDPRERGG